MQRTAYEESIALGQQQSQLGSGTGATGGSILAGGVPGETGSAFPYMADIGQDPFAEERQAAIERIRKQMAYHAPAPTPGAAPMLQGASVPDAYHLPGYDAFMASTQGQIDAAGGRVAPQMAGVQMGPTQGVQAPQMGPLSTYAGAQVGPAHMAQVGGMGQATMAGDSSFRNAQEEAMNYQHGLMTGEQSIAGMKAKREQDALVAAQAGMAAGASPSERARMQRIAGQNMASIGQEMAGRTLEAQLAERQAAAGAYGQLAGQGRAGDLQLGTFNAQQANENSRLGAQLGTSVNLANAGAQNQAGLAQAGFNQQAGLAGMDAANQRQYQQAGFQANADQFTAGAQNNAALQQGQMDIQTQQSNVEAQLRQLGYNDAQIQQMMGLQERANEAQQQGNLAYEKGELEKYLAATNNAGAMQRVSAENTAAMARLKEQQPDLWEKIASGAMSVMQLAPQWIKLFQDTPTPGETTGGGGVGINQMSLMGSGGGDGANWGGAASGAASGAAMGTAILPGWGTAAGAVIGGVAGFFS